MYKLSMSSGLYRIPIASNAFGIRRAQKKSKKKKAVAVKVVSQVPRRSYSSSLVRSSAIFGTSKRCKLNYYTQFSLVTGGTGGAAGNAVFTCNGLFDPDITGVGHQPMGFDQMMQIYDHYTVLAAKATVHLTPRKDTTIPVVGGILLNADTTVVTDNQRLIENGMVKWELLPSQTQGMGRKFVLPVNISKFMGKNIIDEDDYRGDSGANPLEQVFFNVFSYNADFNDTAAPTINCDILIEYYCLFSEPRNMVKS